jgi:hypothetical protein
MTNYTTDEIDNEVPEELNATPARQGMRGVHVLWVLIISLMLVAAALFGSWAWRSGDLARVDPNQRAQPAEAQVFNTQPDQARQNYAR